MAFWGVEVKPKKSYTVKFSDFLAPRFHLSQATLGSKKSGRRTIVRCSVADKPPIYVCSLIPGVVECCSLNLYFDEDVTFSVKGSTSVHLAGYFDGEFDGNESGEDVESDGYSDEEEEDADFDSMDSFIVSEDEDISDDDYDEDWSSEEDEIRTRKSGVTIEELPDETDPNEKSLVPVKALSKDSKLSEGNGSADIDMEDDRNSVQKKESGGDDAGGQSNQGSSSEDEDGFRVRRKRKRREVADGQSLEHEEEINKQPAGTGPADLNVEAWEPVTPSAVEHETDADMKASSKKKRKKKKKKQAKESLEDGSPSPLAQANGNIPTSLKQNDSDRGEEQVKEYSKGAPTSCEDGNKKGTVRKYGNGLEVENIKMGKPNGKQATPGKKVGMIYTGRLRSNDKIFDSNVGKKPFFFRLGVGEVIKGWDIGVNGMRVGDKRHLTIPPDMGYGSKGVPGIPPNSWLKFDIELVEVK